MLSQGPLKVVCKISLLQGPSLNRQAIYHLAVLLMSRTEVYIVTKDILGYT